MKSKYLRIATGCLVGAITFSGMTMSAAAGTAGVTAGIGTILTEAETANPNVDAQIKEYLVPTVKSEYSDIAIAQVDNYVNIRDSASEEGQVLGKLYNNSAATVQGSEGDWYQITSGSVTGYVKGEYVVTGEAGEEGKYNDPVCTPGHEHGIHHPDAGTHRRRIGCSGRAGRLG